MLSYSASLIMLNDIESWQESVCHAKLVNAANACLISKLKLTHLLGSWRKNARNGHIPESSSQYQPKSNSVPHLTRKYTKPQCTYESTVYLCSTRRKLLLIPQNCLLRNFPLSRCAVATKRSIYFLPFLIFNIQKAPNFVMVILSLVHVS